jgi:hypothetical protein
MIRETSPKMRKTANRTMVAIKKPIKMKDAPLQVKENVLHLGQK